MLNYNEKMHIIFQDAEILTARYHNAFNGLGGTVAPKTDEEQAQLDRLKLLMTYNEIKKTNTRTPYKAYMAQFGY